MIFYIVFENNSGHQNFKALHEKFDDAVGHAIALYRQTSVCSTEVHKVWLHDHFSETSLNDTPSHKVWSSDKQSGAI